MSRLLLLRIQSTGGFKSHGFGSKLEVGWTHCWVFIPFRWGICPLADYDKNSQLFAAVWHFSAAAGCCLACSLLWRLGRVLLWKQRQEYLLLGGTYTKWPPTPRSYLLHLLVFGTPRELLFVPPAASVVISTVLSRAVAWTVKLSKKTKPVLGFFLKIRLKGKGSLL